MVAALKTAVGTFAAPVTGTTVDFTIAGFGTPKLVEFYITAGTALGTSVASARIGMGATDGTNQWACYSTGKDNEASPGLGFGFSSSTACLAMGFSTAVSNDMALSFNSWITDGVRLDIDDTTESDFLIHAVFYTGDNISAKVGTLECPDNTGSLAVTGVGFEADVLKFMNAGRALGSGGSRFTLSSGFCVNDGFLTQRCLTTDVETPLCAAYMATDAVYGMLDPNGGPSLSYRQAVSAIGADGFTVTGLSGNPSTDVAHWIALDTGGAAANLVTYTKPVATGEATLVNPGWKPVLVQMIQTALTATDTISSTTNSSAIGFGALTETTAGSVAAYQMDGVTPSRTDCRTSATPVGMIGDNGVTTNTASLTSFDADSGVILNHTATTASATKWIVLSIEDVEAAVTPPASGLNISTATFVAPTTGSTVDFTIPGFGTPIMAEFTISGGVTAETSVVNVRLGLGATDGTSQWSWNSGDADGVAAAGQKFRFAANDSCLSLCNAACDALELELTFNSWITDGVRLNVATPAVSAYLIEGVFTSGPNVRAKVGTIECPDSLTSLVVTGVGFTSDILKFSCVGRAVSNDQSVHTTSIGACINDGSLTQYGLIRDVTTPTAAAYLADDAVYGQITPSTGAIIHRQGITAIGSDGFTVTGISGDPGLDVAHYVAIYCGGAACALEIFTKPTATGTAQLIDPGFKPQFVQAITHDVEDLNEVKEDGMASAIGVCSFTATTSASISVYSTDAEDPSICDSLYSAYPLTTITTEGDVADQATLVSLTAADGATVNFITASALTSLWIVLAIGTVSLPSGALGGTILRRRRRSHQ